MVMILQRKATGRIRTLEVYLYFFYYLRKIYFSQLLNDYFVPYITVYYTCLFSGVCITEGLASLSRKSVSFKDIQSKLKT